MQSGRWCGLCWSHLWNRPSVAGSPSAADLCIRDDTRSFLDCSVCARAPWALCFKPEASASGLWYHFREGRGVQERGPWAQLPGFKSQLCCSLPVSPRASSRVSLRLNFPIWQVGVVTAVSSYYED